MKLVVVFGLQQTGEKMVVKGKVGHLLRKLEESKTTAMKQKVANNALVQFGFK